MRRQPGEIARLQLDAHEHHLAGVLELRPLAERLEERGQDHRRPVGRARQREEDVGAVARPARRRPVHQMAHERQGAGEPPDAVGGGDAAHEPARERDHFRLARQPEADAVEEGAAPSGSAEQDPERVLVQ